MKKAIALMLVLLMAGSSMIACSDTTSDETTDAANTPTADGETVAEETADPNARLDSGLGEVDYEGYNFNIFVHSAISNDWNAEEVTGEPINDAKYERMTTVADNTNVTITPTIVSADNRAGQSPLGNSVKAGTNDYDLAEISAYSACNALTSGFIRDLNSIENLDLTREWWDQYANEDFKFGDSIYMATGDISLADNGATYCIYFNKRIATDYNMPNFYEMVDNMTWTIDNFREFAEAYGADTDNDGNHVNDKEDEYGIYIWDDIMMGIVNASGIKCCTINPDTAELELVLYSEKFVDAFNKFTQYAYNLDTTCAYQRNGYDADWGSIAFKEGRALFYMSNLGGAVAMREMDDDFGILPLPLYDENQDRYYNSIASWSGAFYCIPRNAYGDEGFARTGYLTQALAYESLYTLTPAYYDQTLKGKTSRDEESSAMLDLIFATRTYDFGWYFEIGGYNEGIMNLLRAYSSDVTSMYEKSSKAANKVLSKYNENIKELMAMEQGG
ncbi:MAG: hypothetical protein E7579_04885 [Ruminococcaceae bacterium]|nr:hypothetical protein [Oscillospiraceae bacterium]